MNECDECGNRSETRKKQLPLWPLHDLQANEIILGSEKLKIKGLKN